MKPATFAPRLQHALGPQVRKAGIAVTMHHHESAKAVNTNDVKAHERDWPWRVRMLRARARASGDLRREVEILDRAVVASFWTGFRLGQSVNMIDQLNAPDLRPGRPSLSYGR